MRFLNLQTGLILLTVVVIAATVWSYTYFGRYHPFADLIDQSSPANFSQIQLQVTDAVIAGREGGRLRWRVGAKSISISRDRRLVSVDNLHDGLFYDGHQKPVVKISAGRAIYQTSTGIYGPQTPFANLQVQGGIQATLLAKNGPSITTDSLLWDAQKNIVQTPGHVVAVFPNGAGMASGENIQFNTATGDMSLSHLHGTFRVGKLVE